MAKNFEKEAQKLLDMSDVNQFQSDISDYSIDTLINLGKIFAKYKLENGNGEYDSELNDKIKIIKETRLYKQTTVKSISKVIAKMEKEVKEEVGTPQVNPTKVQKPRNSSLNGISIKNSPDTPKNSGVNYNHQKGQGDFFGKSSAFKFIKDKSDNRQSNSSNNNQDGFDFGDKPKSIRKRSEKSNIIKVSISHLEPKVLKQIKDIGLMVGGGARQSARAETPKKTIKRQTKAEKEKAILKRDELNFKNAHLNEQTRKHRSDSRFDRKKFKETTESNNIKNENQKKTLEFREKVEANKLKRLEINADLKEKLAQNHIEFSKLNLEKLKIKRQADKDKQDGRLQLQKQRKDQTNRNQMERHLHGIHPALGMLYGMSQNRQNQDSQDGDSGGLISSMMGGLAGGVGAAGMGMMGKGGGAFRGLKAGAGLTVKQMSKHLGMNALKLGGSRLPLIGAGIAGISEGMESGSVGKGLATFAGALTGGALLGAAAGAVFGPLGAIVGAIVGQELGSIASKEIFDRLSGSSSAPEYTPWRREYDISDVNKNIKQVPNPNNSQSASGKVGKMGASGEDFLAKEEGLKLKAYLDGSTKSGKDLVSIGRGHQIKDHEYAQGFIQAGQDKIPISGNKGLDTKLTKEQAEALYKKDNAEYSDKARNKLGAEHYDKLTDKQKAALDSYAYNIGSIGGLVKKGLREKIKSGDMQGASEIIRKGINTKDGIYNQGLDDRRKREAAMFSEKAPSKIESLQNSTNRIQDKSMEEKSKPMNVVNVGGSSGGSSSVVNNTYVNPVNTDATPRQLANNMMYPGRLV